MEAACDRTTAVAAAPATSFAFDHSLAKAGRRRRLVGGTGGRGGGRATAAKSAQEKEKRTSSANPGNGGDRDRWWAQATAAAGESVSAAAAAAERPSSVRPSDRLSTSLVKPKEREERIRIPIIATPLIDAPGGERALHKSQHAATSPPLDVRGTLRDDVG